MRNFFVILISAFVLVACSTNIREEFDPTFTKYNDIITGNDLRASGIFVADKAKESYIKSADAAKDTRIFEYRIINKKIDELNRKARVDVELDYYMTYSNRVKTLRYVQEWIWIEEKDFKDWRLLTPLPEFK
jgi:hypothetical protein